MPCGAATDSLAGSVTGEFQSHSVQCYKGTYIRIPCKYISQTSAANSTAQPQIVSSTVPAAHFRYLISPNKFSRESSIDLITFDQLFT